MEHQFHSHWISVKIPTFTIISSYLPGTNFPRPTPWDSDTQLPRPFQPGIRSSTSPTSDSS